MPTTAYLLAAGALVLGVVLGYLLNVFLRKRLLARKCDEADEIISRAREEARSAREAIEAEGRRNAEKYRSEVEEELRQKRREMNAQAARLDKREDAVDRKLALIDRKEEHLNREEARVRELAAETRKKLAEAEELLAREKENLRRIADLSPEQAREELLARYEKEMDREIGDYLHRRREQAKEEAEEQAKEIIVQAIQRCAVDVAQDGLVSTVDLPSDELKGRIIGREGRNIRSFIKATGVDVIVDDTPGVVVVSSFDAVRREIARRALEQLVQDGRIHPARIEEVVAKTEREVEKQIIEEGRRAVREVGLHHLKQKEIELLGRLRFRTSYGQNCLGHSVEVAILTGLMAGELKLNQTLARRCGLLHDIGKAVDHEREGTHPSIGAELLTTFEEPPEVVNAVAAHHEDVPAESLYAILVQAADAISASRPGARRENLERYLQRLQQLESIALNQEGVEKAYAVHAGREIRVIVRADKLGDVESQKLASTIAREVEEQLSYPGEVKVTVIRENRFVEYAR